MARHFVSSFKSDRKVRVRLFGRWVRLLDPDACLIIRRPDSPSSGSGRQDLDIDPSSSTSITVETAKLLPVQTDASVDQHPAIDADATSLMPADDPASGTSNDPYESVDQTASTVLSRELRAADDQEMPTTAGSMIPDRAMGLLSQEGGVQYAATTRHDTAKTVMEITPPINAIGASNETERPSITTDASGSAER